MASALIAIIISLLTGVAAYYVTRNNQNIKVSKREFLIGATVSSIVLILFAPLVEFLILKDKMTYHEYFNGYETAAVEKAIPCDRDGDCNYTYECDYYWVTETYYDDEGDPHTRKVQKHHNCPYLKTEYKYHIETTLGNYPITDTFSDAKRERWQSDEEIPDSIPQGPPEAWLQVKARLDRGEPGGVTKLHKYKNFLLASDKTILDAYSADIEAYKDKKLLPPHTTNFDNPIYGMYSADKFQAVKVSADLNAWNESLARMNGYLGKELQGDVHLVAVPADGVGNMDRYAQSLFAYWKSDEFKKYAFPKNSIGVVVGVKDGKVEWARATGGLPNGNEGLLADIHNNLIGVEFNPDVLIGTPHKQEGTLTNTLYGIHKFKRPCMECVQEKIDGYAYLKSDITISGWERFWIIFIAIILSAGMWAMFLYVDDN